MQIYEVTDPLFKEYGKIIDSVELTELLAEMKHTPVLMLGKQQDITEEFTYDTSKVKAFRVPAGTAVELYATTLHYAPCHTEKSGFQCTIVLPKGTNLDLEKDHQGGEDGHLTAKNKWLLGHPEGGLPEGSPMGLIGENLSLD